MLALVPYQKAVTNIGLSLTQSDILALSNARLIYRRSNSLIKNSAS